MSFIQALILGIIQGITEFFPVSSSAHLNLGRRFMGISSQEDFIYFDLCCHAGTLLALLIYLKSDVWSTLKNIKMIALIALALTPLVPAYFFLKPLRTTLSDPSYLGYFLFITAFILFLASKKQSTSGEFSRPKWKSVLCIGLVQTMALFPGISRSGSTIAAARLLGWDWNSAARFSFLLAIPTILGGQLLETMKLIGKDVHLLSTLPVSCYLGGFITSFGMGLLGVRFVFWVYKTGNVRPFAWYCVGIGIIAWLAPHG